MTPARTLMMVAERAGETEDGIEDPQQDAAAEADPAPDLGKARGRLRAEDIAGGEFRIDLRGVDDGHDPRRNAAAKRDQDRRYQVVLNRRLPGEGRRRRATVRADVHSLGAAGSACGAIHQCCTPSGYSTNFPAE